MDFDIFGTNVTDKVGNRKTLYYSTSNNLCLCTTWQKAETRKSHISLNWIVFITNTANTEHVGNTQQEAVLPS